MQCFEMFANTVATFDKRQYKISLANIKYFFYFFSTKVPALNFKGKHLKTHSKNAAPLKKAPKIGVSLDLEDYLLITEIRKRLASTDAHVCKLIIKQNLQAAYNKVMQGELP